MTKKILCLLLSILIVSSMSLTVSADTYADGFQDQGGFVTSDARISSDGTYYFTIRSNTRSSDEFKAKKSTITVTAKGRIGNTKNGSLTTDEDVSYTVSVYNSNTGELAGEISGTANGKSSSQKINVVSGEQYYLVAVCSPELKMPYNLRIDGKISNIEVIK